MLSADPPLLLQSQILLKVKKEIGAWHSSTREEVSTHPAVFEIIGRRLMSENVYKKLSAWFECPSHLGHQKLVVFHMLKELNGSYAVKTGLFKFVIHYIPCNDDDVRKTFRLGLAVNVLFLGP